MRAGQRIGIRTVIASSTQDEDILSEDEGWSLVCMMNADEDAIKRYVVAWVKRGSDETGVVGWHFKILDGSDIFLEAAQMFDSHCEGEPPDGFGR